MKKIGVGRILVIVIIAAAAAAAAWYAAARIRNRQLAAPGRAVLYYRNPMDPAVTSPVPMKDSMGMDYVPVYAGEASQPSTGVRISQEKQQLIGLTKEAVTRRPLHYTITTDGVVAYDPDLFVAQAEYLQALKAVVATQDSTLPTVREDAAALAGAARTKLRRLGMSDEEIKALTMPQQNLYLPLEEGQVWVYLTVHEYEMSLVKQGEEVAIEAVAFPGEQFKGTIAAIAPVLDAQTRAARVRVLVQDPGKKLKPEMFVNADVMVDLGEQLAVPESAVIDTGMKKVVYVVKEGDILEPRQITVGLKAQGYYAVREGLAEGDVVATSGNFLIDSESRLQGVTHD